MFFSSSYLGSSLSVSSLGLLSYSEAPLTGLLSLGDGVPLSWGLLSSGVGLRFRSFGEDGDDLLGLGLLDLLSSRSTLLSLFTGDLDRL